MGELPIDGQQPEAEASGAEIIGNDRQARDPRRPYGRDKAFGITRKPETAGHDRHAVEHQAIKRRLWRGIDLARHLVLLWLARGLQISRATWKPAKDWLTGISSMLLKLRCAGWLATQKMVEAMSAAVRSEEHTSELQSLMRISYAVFCLKKKKQ